MNSEMKSELNQEYENRMTTLEELNDDNLNDLIENSSYIRHPELNYAH